MCLYPKTRKVMPKEIAGYKVYTAQEVMDMPKSV